MKILSVLLITIYWVLSALDILSVYRKKRRIFKPLLMPVLTAAFISGCLDYGVSVPWAVIAALVCGFLGDTLLLNDRLFAAGLGAFLAGHIFYIIEYLSELKSILLHPAAVLLIIAGYILYIVLVFSRLFPHVEKAMKLPVTLYMVVIMAMSYLAFLRFGNVPAAPFVCTWIGSMLFVLSDTILAFQVFCKKSGRGVMETYCAAQFLIAMGILNALPQLK